MRPVAHYGDACNLYLIPDQLRKPDVLRHHCGAEGRGEAVIEKANVVVVPAREGKVDAVGTAEHLRRLERAGIHSAWALLWPEWHRDAVEMIGGR